MSPGGSALYAAICARELGAEVRVVTSHGPDFVGSAWLHGVSVEVVPAAQTTSFENVYDPLTGRRQGRQIAMASPLGRPTVDGDVVFVCPVAGEAQPIRGAAVGLQGWLREPDAFGLVHLLPLAEAHIFAGCRAAFVSAEDLGEDLRRVLPLLREVLPLLVVTHGAAGADLHLGPVTHHIAPCPAAEVDPTGAGDVFATAFLLAMARGESPFFAGSYAACAASIVVEGVGPSALSRLSSELPRRMGWYGRNAKP